MSLASLVGGYSRYGTIGARSFWLAKVMFTFAYSCAIAWPVAAAVTFKNSPVKLIETGLKNMGRDGGPRQAAIWVNDHTLVANVPLEKSTHDPHNLGRTVMYDLNTGKTSELMRYASPLCWDASLGRAAAVFYPNPDNPREQQTLALRIDFEGSIIDKQFVAPGAGLGPDCDMTVERPKGLPERVRIRLRPPHGFIDLGQTGKRWDDAAVLHRTDGKKIKLATHGWTIDHVRYLDFLDKYQLDTGSGCLVKGEKCPPDIHLMDTSGAVTSIQLPAGILDLISVTRVHVVKNGLLFRVQFNKTNRYGYFLLRNGVLHELWRPGSPGLMKPGPTEPWGREAISPDGCKVAFRRGTWPRQTFIFDHCAIGR